MRKTALCAAGILFFLLPASGIVIKEEIKDYKNHLDKTKKELTEIRKQINKERKEIKKQKYRKKVTVRYIHKLSRELDITRKELEVFDNNIKVVKEGLRGLKERIRETKKEIKEKKEQVRSILKNQYKKRGNEYIELILKSGSFSELIKRYKFVKVLSGKNVERIKKYKKLMAKLNEDKKSMELYEKELEQLKKEKQKEWERYKNEKWRKYVLLKNIKNSIKKRSKMVKELEKSAKKLNNLVEELEVTAELTDKKAAEAFRDYKGKFPWPVSGGKVLAGFGKYKHPKFKSIVYNNGLHINAKYGSPVYCIFNGSVKYADWFEGYGKMVIVNHGGGYFTIYSHLSKISVRNGDEVGLKEKIGEVGDTESFYGSELYFEIRYKSKPINPLKYLE